MNISNKEFIYFSKSIKGDDDDDKDKWKQEKEKDLSGSGNRNRNNNELLKHFFPDILKALGNSAIKETTPSLQELEQYLQNHIQDLMTEERKKRRRLALSSGGRSNR